MSAPIGSPYENNFDVVAEIETTALADAKAAASGRDDAINGVNFTHSGQDYIIIENYSRDELFAFLGTFAVPVTPADIATMVAEGHQELIDILANADIAGGTMLCRESTNSRFFNMNFTVQPDP